MELRVKNVKTIFAGAAKWTNLEALVSMLSLLSTTAPNDISHPKGIVVPHLVFIDIKETRDNLASFKQRNPEHSPETQAEYDVFTNELSIYAAFFNMWTGYEFPGYETLREQNFHNLDSITHVMTPYGISFSFMFKDALVLNVFLSNDFLEHLFNADYSSLVPRTLIEAA